MKLLSTVLLAASSLPFAAAAQTAPVMAKPAPDPSKRVCRQDRSTGSIMPKSICHTRAEWQVIDNAGDQSASRLRDAMQTGDSRPQ